jgi:GntR family transcriptional regulator/MocR family aminotransferase
VRRVAIEDPSGAEMRRILEEHGLRWRGVPVDAEGIAVDALEEQDGAVLVTPAHQFPLGVTCSPERRTALLEWARRTGAWILEDDYDGEFRYDRQPVGALQALDPSRVVYIGTASKVLAPGVRLAWMAVPRPLLTPLAEVRRHADRQSPTLEQLALCELVRSGAFERHLRRMRREYRRRRDVLLAALARSAPGLAPAGIAAGLHLVLPLPPGGPSEAEVQAAAAARGLQVHGLGAFDAGTPGRPIGVVLGYGTPPANGYDAAVGALAGALEEVLAPGRRAAVTAARR